jgi:nucleotide-binding universal stress UspA family protein
MSYKTILTILTEPEHVDAVLPQAIAFADGAQAHLDVLCLGIDRTQMGYYYAGATALMHQETLAFAQSVATESETAARAMLKKSSLSWGVDAMLAQSANVGVLTARRARFADLVILPKPYGKDQSHDAPILIEAAMFQGRSPVLVLAGDAAPATAPRHAVIAWNESEEALVATRRALPLLKAAGAVEVLIVAPERHAADVTDPGAELARMLSRHGVKIEITIVPLTLPRVSEVINRHVADTGADLVVMGAYGHSRFREAILGGATRNQLEHATVPVLMAH